MGANQRAGFSALILYHVFVLSINTAPNSIGTNIHKSACYCYGKSCWVSSSLYYGFI